MSVNHTKTINVKPDTNEYTNSRFTNKKQNGVNEDYHLSCCEMLQLPDVLDNMLPPFSRSYGVRLLVDSVLQPQMGMFITRYGSFSTDANNLLSTNSTISKHAFKLSY